MATSCSAMRAASSQAASARSQAGSGDNKVRIRSTAQRRFTAVGLAFASMSQVAVNAASEAWWRMDNATP